MKYVLLAIITVIAYIVLYNWANDIQIHVFDSHKEGPRVFMIGGTHGNEPAGTLGLEQLMDQFRTEKMKLESGLIAIVSHPNKIGLSCNSRWLLHRLWYRDLNRNYQTTDFEQANEPISRRITNWIREYNINFILDFHEGWGYSIVQRDSMGSGIFPGLLHNSRQIAEDIVVSLNHSISNPSKKFTLQLNKHPTIRSLKNHANYKKIDYILVETSGQNDIQPKSVRIEQVLHIIHHILQRFQMVSYIK
jgi:predicted deacylase